MISEAISALSFLKSASETAKALVELRDISQVREKAIDLQGKILAAQQSSLDARDREDALRKRISELECQVSELADWRDQKQDYKLSTVGTGAFVYARKPSIVPAEPPHWLCTKCYASNKKSILQYAGRTNRDQDSLFQCLECKGRVQTHWSTTPEKHAAKLAEKKAAGIPCPHCGQATQLVSESDHPTFGVLGIKLHELKCTGCAETVTRDFSPATGHR